MLFRLSTQILVLWIVVPMNQILRCFEELLWLKSTCCGFISFSPSLTVFPSEEGVCPHVKEFMNLYPHSVLIP
jgi:hypothetical protein